MAVTQNFTLDKNDGSGVKLTRPWTMNVSVFPGEEVFAGTGANPGRLLRWAANSDGSGTTYEIGAVVPLARKVYYAVWLKPTPYLVTDWDLEAVADAIRAKGGTSEQLAFPAGFVDAIEDIQTGPAAHTVTVQLTHPNHPEGFGSCVLRDGGANGEQVGEITSATGSATVTVSAGILYIALTGSGVLPPNILSYYLITGDIGVGQTSGGIPLIVGSDGSVSIDYIDWDN